MPDFTSNDTDSDSNYMWIQSMSKPGIDNYFPSDPVCAGVNFRAPQNLIYGPLGVMVLVIANTAHKLIESGKWDGLPWMLKMQRRARFVYLKRHSWRLSMRFGTSSTPVATGGITGDFIYVDTGDRSAKV